MDAIKEWSICHTPLGLGEDGKERGISKNVKAYREDMVEVYEAALAAYSIESVSLPPRKLAMTLRKRRLWRQDTAAFDNTDPALGDWLLSHTALVAEFSLEGGACQDGVIHSILIAYSGFERRYIILHSSSVAGCAYLVCATSLADEFLVRRKNGRLVVYPFHLHRMEDKSSSKTSIIKKGNL
jgi:hypothetical protein